MFTVIYINKDSVIINQEYLFDIKDEFYVNEYLLRNELVEQLYFFIESLTLIQKRRIIDFYFNNRTIKEIALKENVSESAVRKSIDQSLIKLKGKLMKFL